MRGADLKRDDREALKRDVEEFLSSGGEIKQVTGFGEKLNPRAYVIKAENHDPEKAKAKEKKKTKKEQIKDTYFRLFNYGKTDKQIATILGVKDKTVRQWRLIHQEELGY